MKLIIQIPCFNEEQSLPATFIDLPKRIEGIDKIEVLVVDDGSTDRTAAVAEALGVHHIVRFKANRGLARAFEAGLERCLAEGADIIVNTDADNQYRGQDIEPLVRPILDGRADAVVGDRQTDGIEHFTRGKKFLQKWGSSAIRRLSGTQVRDAVSGFRAFSRQTAIRLNILSDFSYTVENLIQLGDKRLKVLSVPIRTNGQTRPSRLFRSVPHFIANQLATLLRIYSTYRPLRVFSAIGILLMLPGLVGFIRFIYFYFVDGGLGHIQSLVFSAVSLNLGFLVIVFGILADLIANNRKLIEKLLIHQRDEKWNKPS